MNRANHYELLESETDDNETMMSNDPHEVFDQHVNQRRARSSTNSDSIFEDNSDDSVTSEMSDRSALSSLSISHGRRQTSEVDSRTRRRPERERTVDSIFSDPSTKEQVYPVPDMEKTSFSSWDSFLRYFYRYRRDTFQMLSIRSGVTSKARNAVIAAGLRTKYGYDSKMLDTMLLKKCIPEEFKAYSKRITCTHSGAARIRASANGRPRQHYRAVGCPAKISVCLQWSPEHDAFRVCVTEQVAMHSHPVTEELFEDYPENRQVSEPSVLQTVKSMMDHGTPRKGILAYITGSSCAEPTLKDVHNLMAKMKRDKYADHPAVESRVNIFIEKEGNVGRIFTSEEKGKEKLQALTLQTRHMRSMFEQFPEVLLIDATHNTNSARFKLFSFMVHDALGNGQHVQHSLIADERGATLRTVCEQFKAANPLWRTIRCIVLDKDFTEMSVIAGEFPDARILLCKFHVLKYLSEEVCKSKYGLSEWQKRNMIVTIAELIDAKSEAAYARKIAFMRVILRTPDACARERLRSMREHTRYTQQGQHMA